jgi:hypothetical protein
MTFEEFVLERWEHVSLSSFERLPFHDEIFRTLGNLVDMPSGAVTISAPPRSGKSLITSVLFPLWLMNSSDRKDLNVANVSARKDVAMRNIQLFKVPAKKQGDRAVAMPTDKIVALINGFRYFAWRVGESTMGPPMDLIIMDDPGTDPFSPGVLEFFHCRMATRFRPGAFKVVAASDDLPRSLEKAISSYAPTTMSIVRS